MDIDALIRDLIQEDQFKAKYTNRQRSIFCQNMYGKVSAFLQSHEEQHQKELKESQNKLKETQTKLEKYRKAYTTLYKETDTYLWVTLVYAFICIVFFVYIYYDFILRPYLNP